MLLFSATTFVLFRFGLDGRASPVPSPPGVLLATVLFAAILAINRGLRRRARAGRLRPDPPGAGRRHLAVHSRRPGLCSSIWRRSSSFAVPVFAILFLDDAGGLLPFAGVLALTDLGLAAIGALIASLAVNSRARDLIGPLLLLPAVGPGDDRRRRRGRAAARRWWTFVREFRQVDGGTRLYDVGVLPRRLCRLRLRTRGLTEPDELLSRTPGSSRGSPRRPSRPAFALVFFSDPDDADQGFIQKIFYLHVPLASLPRCAASWSAPVFAILHLRSGDSEAGTCAPTSRSTSR